MRWLADWREYKCGVFHRLRCGAVRSGAACAPAARSQTLTHAHTKQTNTHTYTLRRATLTRTHTKVICTVRRIFEPVLMYQECGVCSLACVVRDAVFLCALHVCVCVRGVRDTVHGLQSAHTHTHARGCPQTLRFAPILQIYAECASAAAAAAAA